MPSSSAPFSSLLYRFGIDVIAPLATPGYHDYTDQMVGELMAIGAHARDRGMLIAPDRRG